MNRNPDDATIMNLPFSGGCLCGEVRYECSSHPLAMVNCHCRDCQRLGGGPYAPIVVMALSAFKITQGALRHYATTRLGGSQNLRGFCAGCGSRLTAGEDPKHDIIGLMACSLDDPGWFKASMDIFVRDAQPWHLMDADVPKHQRYMPRDK